MILLLAAAILFTPHGFDRRYVNPDGPAAHYPVRALRAGPMHTTFVVDDPLGVRLYFDNHSMSGNGFRARVYMRLMAHIPLLAHPDPGRALLIGFGVGNTAAAIGAHDTIERLDIVDLHRQVFETAPALREIHGGIQADPRVHLYVDDGRTFLQRPGPLYDLITTEPPPPQHAGVYRLYSREFYRDVLARLSPDGLMSQWLPTYQLPARITDGMIATFLDVFPHAALFTGYGREFILVGGRTPIDFARIEERLATQPSVQDDLHALGVTSAVGLLARLVQDDGALRATFAGAPPRSDRAGDLLELLPSPPSRRVIPYDPGQVLSALGGAGTRHASVLTHLGRLMFHVPNFPADSLMTVRNSQSSPVELAMVDWSRVEELLERYTEARQRRDFGAAVEALEKELEVAHEQPAVLLELAQIYLGVGRPRDALETIERFRTLMPEEAAGWAVQGAALLDLGEPRRAEADLRRALEIDPRNVLASLYLEVMPARPRASFEEAGIPRSISLDHYVGWPNRRVQRTSEQKTKEPKG